MCKAAHSREIQCEFVGLFKWKFEDHPLLEHDNDDDYNET